MEGFDEDGRLDPAIANSTVDVLNVNQDGEDGTVEVQLGAGDGTFGAPDVRGAEHSDLVATDGLTGKALEEAREKNRRVELIIAR